MSVDRFRVDWITRRRYLAYLAVVSVLGGGVIGYLLGGEHTGLAIATGGVVAALLVVPRVLASRPIFDERDRRIDARAATYTMYVVTALSVTFLVTPIVLEQLGVLPLQGWMLFAGLVLIAEVYLYIAISLVLRFNA